MKPPKLYRKVWLEINVDFEEYHDYVEYVGVRRALKSNGSWFWQIDPWYKEDFEGEILGTFGDRPEDWFDYVVYKYPYDFDHRNCGTYNRATIKKQLPSISAQIGGIGEVDFDSDIPF